MTRGRVRDVPSLEFSRGWELHRIKQAALWFERSAVQGRVAVARHGRQMLGRGVSLVMGVAVTRIAGVLDQHLAIARDFGHDRGGRDGCTSPVTLRHAALGDLQIGMRNASTMIMSGSGAIAMTARRIASSEAR
jgi:hypothetical protein